MKKNLVYFIFCIFLFFIHTSLIGYEKVIVNDEIQRTPIGQKVYYIADPEKKISIQEILTSEYQNQFIKSEEDGINFGQTNYDYWIRITFANAKDISDLKLLEIDYSNIDKVEFYRPNSNGEFEVESSGMLFPFYIRKFINRNFVYDINLAPNEEKTYYIRATTSGGLILPFVLWNKDKFNQYNADIQHGLGLYYGVMIVMILYNIFIFLSVRDISYFYYVMYIIGFLGIQLVLTGHGFQYLWSNYPWMQRNFYVIFSGICLTSILLFSKRFLNIKETVPKMDKLMQIFIFLEAIMTFTPLIFPPEITIKISLVLTLPPVILIFIAAILAFIRKYRPARYFLLAFTVLQLAGLIVVLKFINVLSSNVFTEYGLYYGSAMEVILLSIALADRINIMKKEKEEAQQRTLEMQKILTESYARFVPKDFLASLGKESILDVRLGDQIQKDMAVMFSDIRSFTTLSEQMTPAENFNFINSYLKRMSPIIQKHNGFIDKFIGDAIMALFQKSVIDAVSAGIEMQKYLEEYNGYRANRNYDPIQIGVGIHSGSLMLGTIGAEERLEGTVISDTVNLASRIESLTKIYGSRIAVSESTVLEIKNDSKFHFRFLDRVKVKGKQKPVSIYEILDSDQPEEFDLKLKTKPEYDQAVKFFHSDLFEDAKEYFNRVVKVHPDDKVAQFYLKRLFPATHPIKIAENE
ncbi:7TM diverse intracellular signaling domain-containing protein [Leptospira sp. WS92.C1]